MNREELINMTDEELNEILKDKNKIAELRKEIRKDGIFIFPGDDRYDEESLELPFLCFEEMVNLESIRNKTTTPKKVFKTYLIKDILNKTIKIGKSVNPDKRFKHFTKNNPNLELIHVIDNDVEHELHKEYKIKRRYGEWFNLNKRDIDEIIKKY